MKVSKRWIDKFFDGGLPDTQTICDALTFHAFEIDGVETVHGDDILDVKVTPNRGHDCLSHRGIAKELSAILGKPLKNDPFTLEFDISKTTSEVTVAIEDSKLCSRYIAAYIKGVKVGPSPDWLKSSLENLGQRSINNVVDVTNMVMFNTGQPIHAFDAGRLGSLDIGVRLAREGETMEALDGVTYRLKPSELVISAADRPVGIAGIKGGMADKIDESTTDLIIESATFDVVTIRKGSAELKLRTDASTRFEQGLSPELAAHGMRQVAKLITETMGGECVGFVDVYPNPAEQKPVSVTLEKINAVLGTDYSNKEVSDALGRLGLEVSMVGSTFTVTPSFERLDILIPDDLVEEVGRIIGYDKVEPKLLPALERKPAINKNFYWSERVREFLMSKGFSEIYTSVFAEEGERIVLNKVDGVRPYLRSSLVPGMEEALEKNKRNAEMLGLPDVRLFEIGTVFESHEETPSKVSRSLLVAGEKLMLAVGVKGSKKSPKPDALITKMFETLEMNHTNKLEFIGMVSGGVVEVDLETAIAQLPDPVEYEKLPLSETERYQPFSKYPFIIRDVAFWADKDANLVEMEKMIKEMAGALCSNVFLFDRFEKPASPAGGEGRVSLAYRLVFQSFERTLTEAEVNPNMDAVYTALKDKGFSIR